MSTILLREYETTYILRSDLDAAERQKVEDRVKSIIEEQFGGEIRRVDDWGRRRLAYPIRKQGHGVYVYNRYAAPADCILELERVLRLLDPVVKFLTVKLEAGKEVDARPDGESRFTNDGDEEE